jgi:alkanesulfonate monooxygenase SsuD/methylene tetrahydromethanopterin reductase-like flavin-dependent oxidoreductase (luciferase family)
MKYDIFFSISQTPVDGHTPTEKVMFENFFDQVIAADDLGFGTAWIAESHLSSQVQKRNRNPVIPHWQGEVGLNVDFLQLTHKIYAKTSRIQTGSAIMNILCMGGPIAAAERVAAFCTLQGLDPSESRPINVGFAAGRFNFMNEASGVVPRNDAERAAGRVWKNKVFAEATDIFLRLLRGDTICSDDIELHSFKREDFRSEDHWAAVVEAHGEASDEVPVEKQWVFESVKLVPSDWRRD